MTEENEAILIEKLGHIDLSDSTLLIDNVETIDIGIIVQEYEVLRKQIIKEK